MLGCVGRFVLREDGLIGLGLVCGASMRVAWRRQGCGGREMWECEVGA
jgi:hypothetical protein